MASVSSGYMLMTGRPTKDKEEYNEMAKSLSLLGATDEQMAGVFDTSVATLNNWKNQYPEFLEALKEGKAQADSKVAESLYNKALSGDTTACIFWLKNRQPDVWRDKKEVLVEKRSYFELLQQIDADSRKDSAGQNQGMEGEPKEIRH